MDRRTRSLPPVDDGTIDHGYSGNSAERAIAGGSILGGAVLGGVGGMIVTLKQEGVDNQFSRQEKRDTIANVLIGAGVGAAAGVALITAKHFIPKMNNVPILGAAGPWASVGVGAGIGAAGYGAYTLASHLVD